MTFFTKRYYPTVCVRRAEMKAMEKLPETEKVKMLPIVLLAPWLNSIKFDNTHRIIENSIGKIPIIVDLDRSFHSESNLSSREYFRDLLDVKIGPEKWMELIQEHENYIPCIQFSGIDKTLIDEQVEFSAKLGRGFAIRIELQRQPPIEDLIQLSMDNKDLDFVIIIDYGYIIASDITESRISAIMDRFLSVSDKLKFVITGSSFPNSFSDYDDFSEAPPIFSRLIYENLARKYGNYNFFYGDWASTKPRTYDGGGGTPLPRIDFPTSSRWIIARSKENEWDFQTASEKITRLPEWKDRPMVWGTGMIEKSAKGLPGGISTGPQAIAARVNIHLYLQNNFGIPTAAKGPVGKWIDPI
ncbi:MAG: beta family protein [Rhizorhabdus sp.]|uniref:beta family protein n=1 Tax=Rhizorhabdus sp. TaxID=1968843 RepID=UPI001B4DFD4C|nr:hypothetical protein [Rhizorhabdus sp.]MBP8234557.1 beta family protein [Rhizorhabdus sp.]